MKILLVTRGSQGDVLPYLAIAAELERRGHEVTINLPQIFEETVKPYGFKYVLQQFDDIGGMIADAHIIFQYMRIKYVRFLCNVK